MELFSQTAQMVAILWGWGFWGNSRPILPPPIAVFKATVELGKGGGIRANLKATKITAPRFSCFS